MSYSFRKRGATKALVMAAIIAELDNVVSAQPVHAADRAQAETAAESFLGVLPEPNESQEFSVDVCGSVSWNGLSGTENQVITGASINVNASLVTKETQAPQ